MPCIRPWPIKESAPNWENTPARHFSALAGYVPQQTGDRRIDTSIVYDPTDANTNYYNLGTKAVRWKFIQLSAASLFIHSLGCLAVIIYDLFHALTLNYFLIEDEELIGRVKLSAQLIVHLLASPFLVIALQCLALYGVCMTSAARKYVPAVEVLLYGMNGAADRFAICSYRPLYHCLTLPFYPCWIVKNYEAMRMQRDHRAIFEQG